MTPLLKHVVALSFTLILCSLLAWAGLSVFAVGSSAGAWSVTSLKNPQQNVLLPKHWLGKPLLVAFGFDPKQQGQLENWLEEAHKLAKEEGAFANGQAIEVAVVAPHIQKFKTQLLPWMQGQIKKKELLPSVYVTFTPEQTLKAALQLPKGSTVALCVFNAKGQLYWQKAGPVFNKTNREALLNAVASLK
jgi:hypothetical protein